MEKNRILKLNYNKAFLKNPRSDLSAVGAQAVGGERLAADQDGVFSDAVGRLQQGLHAERHCLHTLAVAVPLEQGAVQRRDHHLAAKHLRWRPNKRKFLTNAFIFRDRIQMTPPSEIWSFNKTGSMYNLNHTLQNKIQSKHSRTQKSKHSPVNLRNGGPVRGAVGGRRATV